MKPWLIGENNPYSSDPYYALYPYPERSAGWRLCTQIFGMRESLYLRTFERRNLLMRSGWSKVVARAEARNFLGSLPDPDTLILCGTRVAEAFGLPKTPFKHYTMGPSPTGLHVPWKPGQRVAVLPHPSGLSRVWNQPDACAHARDTVRAVAPGIADLLGSRFALNPKNPHEHEFEANNKCDVCGIERCENCHTLHNEENVCPECGPRP